jgi:hypothetical protein
MASNSLKKNSKKNIVKLFKLKHNALRDNYNNYENVNDYKIKRFKTERKIGLDKNTIHLITENKNKIKYSNQIITTSANTKKLTEDNQNSANFFRKEANIGKIMENSQQNLGIKEYKLSPIKLKGKNYNEKKVNNLKKSIKGIKNCNYISNHKNFIQNSDIKTKIERKYTDIKSSKRKNNSKIKDKIYTAIDSIINSNTNNYNTISIKKFDSINNSISRNYYNSMNCKIDSYFFRKTNLQTIKKKF